MSTAEQFPVTTWQGLDGVDARRVARGMSIASSSPTPIIKTEDGWLIQSQSRPNVYYRLWMDEYGVHCDCPDSLRTCKHVVALASTLDPGLQAKAMPALASAAVLSPDEHPVTEPEPIITTPKSEEPEGPPETPEDPPETPGQSTTNWHTYNLTQTNEKRLFKRLLHALCAQVLEPEREGRGRRPVPVRDLIFGEVYREHSGLSSRRCRTDIEEVATDGYISKAYGHNAGTDFLNQSETTDLLRALITESARPLRGIEHTFAPDSSGFSTSPYGRWHDEKHGGGNTGATYVNTHIIVGVKSHIITSAFASVEQVGDITQFPEMLEETQAAGFPVDEIVADGAYLSEPMLKRMNDEGIGMWVPFRRNSKFHNDHSVWDKHLALFLFHQEKFAEHYHQRSQVETVFSMIKAKYGSTVRGRTPISQANNVLCKLLANNLYVLIRSIYELGLEPEFAKIEELQNVA